MYDEGWNPSSFSLVQTSVTLASGYTGTYTDNVYFNFPNAKNTDYSITWLFKVTGNSN